MKLTKHTPAWRLSVVESFMRTRSAAAADNLSQCLSFDMTFDVEQKHYRIVVSEGSRPGGTPKDSLAIYLDDTGNVFNFLRANIAAPDKIEYSDVLDADVLDEVDHLIKYLERSRLRTADMLR